MMNVQTGVQKTAGESKEMMGSGPQIEPLERYRGTKAWFFRKTNLGQDCRIISATCIAHPLDGSADGAGRSD
jgi:hypothetical protein